MYSTLPVSRTNCSQRSNDRLPEREAPRDRRDHSVSQCTTPNL